LPIPGSPTIVTSSHRRSATARCHASRIVATSRSRPTKTLSCERSDAPATATSLKADTGSALPFRSSGSAGSTSAASRTSSTVARPISTSLGSAACCSRAATLTASPVASRSSVPVTTSPVLTPIRPSMPSCGKALRISTAARQARNASSSCTAGTPKTAITASPMNFSTEPPWCSTIAFIRSK
jgi:hypothetical protein